MDLRIVTLAERPTMKTRFANAETEPWPVFVNEDPMAELYYSDVRTANPEHALMAYDAEAPDQAIARAYSVPFAWDGDPALGELPVDGWDGVVWRAARDRQTGRKPNLVSALEITIPTDLQGTGLSGRMLAAMRDNAARLGFAHLVAPVRPNRKHLVPDMPIEEYAGLVREDGLPQDPWLRVHVRAGGRIVGTSKRAMVIPGTLAQWRSWTGLPFDRSGPVVVPGALVPVQCDVEHDYAVYVEPGVWVHHPL
ncbi:N-acetyltransferase [Streptomyces sp. NPDC006367]|uniref:N-acetyltransferase n=1 Tax=unclassified Streptomyces TaxID=2593676 RepID=UPI0033B3E8FC